MFAVRSWDASSYHLYPLFVHFHCALDILSSAYLQTNTKKGPKLLKTTYFHHGFLSGGSTFIVPLICSPLWLPPPLHHSFLSATVLLCSHDALHWHLLSSPPSSNDWVVTRVRYQELRWNFDAHCAVIWLHPTLPPLCFISVTSALFC